MDYKFARNLLLKALIIFIIANILFASLNVAAWAGKVSLYNHLLPGRQRFPFGENSAQSYNVSVYNLDALFASHQISGQAKAADEYRVLLIGDFAVWGTLLKPEETLAGQLQALHLNVPTGKNPRFYNLGYPTMSLVKDLLILERALQYQPDMILWSVTLESLVRDNQFNSPLVMHNLDQVANIDRQYALNLNPPANKANHNGLANSVFGQRREMADLVRLQMYGVLWAATGLDQYYPPVYSLALRDFEADASFYNLKEPLKASDLALNTLRAGYQMAGKTPVLIVNEPILISSGSNSDIRYNFYYPRWAYDSYRTLLADTAARENWLYLDAWDFVSESEFTNTAVHLSPFGVGQEIEILQAALPETIQSGRVPDLSELALASGAQAGFEPVDPTPEVSTANPATAEPAATAQDTAVSPTINPIDIATLPATTTPDSIDTAVTSVPTGGACLAPEKWQEMPVVPEYVSNKAIQIYQAGLKSGNNPQVFSVIGDCQNVPTVFLGMFESPKNYKLGEEYAYLQPMIDHFSGSFNRKGLARKGGLNVAAALSPLRADPKLCEKNETPVQCELRVNKPSIVIVSLEEWWSKSPIDTYEGYLRKVLDEIIAHGAVPVLSTKADNLEGNHSINQVITKLACEYQVPLWNFWSAAQPLPSHGLWTDGFHLTTGLYDFTQAKNLAAGRSMRNLTGLQALDQVWRGLNRLPVRQQPK